MSEIKTNKKSVVTFNADRKPNAETVITIKSDVLEDYVKTLSVSRHGSSNTRDSIFPGRKIYRSGTLSESRIGQDSSISQAELLRQFPSSVLNLVGLSEGVSITLPPSANVTTGTLEQMAAVIKQEAKSIYQNYLQAVKISVNLTVTETVEIG